MRDGRRAAVVALVLSVFIAVIGAAAYAGEVADPGAAGNGFVHVSMTDDNITGTYSMGIAIVLPSGDVVESDDISSFGLKGRLCSLANGAGSCNAGLTALGSAGDDWSEGGGTEFVRMYGTEAGGWCGTKCYVNPSTIVITGGTDNYIKVNNTWVAAEVITVTVDTTVTPTSWPADWYSSSGNPSYVPPATTPEIDVTGAQLPGVDLEIVLTAPDSDGEDVTCTVQGDPANPHTGTVASGAFEIWSGTSTSFADNGMYAIECAADDGAFDLTDDGEGNEIESVRRVLTIGTGLEGIIDTGCGSWTNIACHFGRVLTWAFVPSEETVSGFVDSISNAFPFSLGADLVDAVTSLVAWDGSTAVRPSISLPAYVPGLNDPTAVLTILGPNTSGSAGDACTYDAGDLGASPDCASWAFGGDGGVAELWGYRETVRLIATLVLYLGFAMALWKRFDREASGE